MRQKMLTGIAKATAILMITLAFTGCANQKQNAGNADETINQTPVQATSEPTHTPEPAQEKAEVSFGDTIEFSGFELTIGDSIEWTILDNAYSDHNGADIVKLPVYAKNIGDETQKFSFMWCKTFGANGLEQDMIQAFFKDDLRSVGEMRPGAETSAYMYFIYDGDGDYYISLENGKEICEVKIPVTKD